MIPIQCRTNLDVQGENWPEALPAVPRMGDYIESGTIHGLTRLSLEVKRVSWKPEYLSQGRINWYAEVELGLPALPWLTMNHFTAWYEHVRGILADDYYRERIKVLDEEYYRTNRR